MLRSSMVALQTAIVLPAFYGAKRQSGELFHDRYERGADIDANCLPWPDGFAPNLMPKTCGIPNEAKPITLH